MAHHNYLKYNVNPIDKSLGDLENLLKACARTQI